MKRIEIQSVIDNISISINERIHPIHIRTLLQDTDAVIFGGAIRNSISRDYINDIDIICYQHSFDVIVKRLNDSKLNIEEEDVSLSNDYAGFAANSKISKVINFYLLHKKETSLIQLILLKYPTDSNFLVENIQEFVSDVDIRACAMLFAPQHNTLLECIPGAFEDCKRKRIFVNKKAVMYFESKYIGRKYKLEKLGWKAVN